MLPLLLLLASPASLSAANTETTTASGLSGATTAGPGDKVQVFSVGLTGDGTDDVTSIRVTLSDLSSATGIASSAFTELRIYESTDATLDIPGDTQVGSQSTVNLSGNTNVSVSTGNIPNTVEYFYFGVAVIATTITEGHAFRSAFTGGFVATSNANLGTAFSASDANRVTLDVTATVLELTTAPADANVYDTGNDEVVSGQTFDTQPVITMKDANGNVDTSFGENIEASLTSGSGSLGGTAAVSPSSGVATFTNLAYTAASDGEGFQITFDDASGGADLTLVTTAGGLSADVIATQLAFTQQPSGAANGAAMSTQPAVTARDADSLTDTDFTDTITLTESGTGSLVNPTLAATSGVATFSTLQYTAVTDQEAVTLTADDASGGSGGDLSSVNSSSLTASAGTASQVDLSFDTSAIQADASSTKSVSILVLDATGLRRTTDNSTSVTLAVSGTGTGGGTLTVSGGSASFTVTSTTSVGTVNLTATSGGLSGDTGTFSTANNAPVANAQTVAATEDVDVTITLTGSDSDNDAITFLISTLPSNGTLFQTTDGTTRSGAISTAGSTVTDGSGRVVYVSAPDGNGSGHGSFGFKSNDGSVNSSEATVTVNVTGTEDSPKAVNDVLSVNEDMPADLSVLANDSEPDGDALTLESVSGASLGSVSVNSNGTVRYAPQSQVSGSDSFTYTINDGKGNTATATASVTIVSVNDEPVPSDDHAETAQDTRVRIGVLENDTDVESTRLSVVDTSFPEHGSVSVTGGEWIDYNPHPGFYGEDSFTYVLKDGHGGTATGRVRVTVLRANRSPIVVNDAVFVTKADSLPVLIDLISNDSDPDNDALTIHSITAGPYTESVTVNDEGWVVYRPIGLIGETDVLSYTVSDGFGGTDSGQLVVTLERSNTAPVARDDSVRVRANVLTRLFPTSNDADPDGDPLRILSWLDVVAATRSDSVSVDVMIPEAGEAAYRYVVGDPFGLADTARVFITVYLNSAPVAHADTTAVRQSGWATVPVLLNDTDIDADSLSIAAIAPGKGTADVQVVGDRVHYRAAVGFVGADVLTYSISDQNGGTATGNLVVLVDGNHDPEAVRDSVSTGTERTVDLDVIRNDHDPDGDALRVTAVSEGVMGRAEIVENRVRYTPHAGLSGRDALTYELADGLGGRATGTFVVMILDAPPPGDLDGDFDSGPEDVLPFAAGFGAVKEGPGFNPAFDLDGSGVVDFIDFLMMLELWSR